MTKVKKIVAAVLTLCLVFGCISASAASKGLVYESKTSDYTATKISHPEAGYGEVDGIVDFPSGDADRGQSYSWSAVGYGDYVYIGTCYAAVWETVKIVGNMTPGMQIDVETARAAANAAFNGKLYTGDLKNNPEDLRRAVIVKINTKTGDTDIVYDTAENGFHYGGFRAAIEFNGKLYFCNTYKNPQIMEVDPKTDKVNIVYTCDPIDYSKPENQLISSGIRGIANYNGMLVVSAIRDDGAYIVASKDPSKGQDSFKVVGTQKDLLDYPAYMFNDAIFGGSVFDMVSFNGKLYITVVAGKFDPATKEVPKKGFALFEVEEKDGKWTYNLLVGDKKDGAKYPFGFGGDRSGAANMVVHDNHLYVGGYNDPMVAVPNALLQMNFESIYKDLKDPVCLWRMDTQGNWELVVGDPNEYFPEVAGNRGEGFDSAMNQYVWRMQDFDNKLYVGTFDVTGLIRPIAQLCNGDILKNTAKDWGTQIQYIADLIKLITKSGAQTMSLKNDTLSDAQALLGTMKDMKGLLNKGGINDLKASEQLHALLLKGIELYGSIREYLPAEVAKALDQVFSQEIADKLFYFIGTCEYLSKSEEGFDLLVTEDGVNFEAVSRDGLGDKYNHGIRTFAVNNDGIFLGTANPFYGTQVWHVEERTAAPAPDSKNSFDMDKNADVKADAKAEVKADVKSADTNASAGTAKDEVPNTGATAGIGLAVTALAAGAVLVICKKKKVF